MTIIFENKEKILRSDLPIQIGRAILFVGISYLISKIKFAENPENSIIKWIFWIGLFILFTYLIFTAKTIKRIEKIRNEEKIRFTFSRQLRPDLVKDMNIRELKIDMKKEVTRGIVTYVLKISDGKNKLKIKANQKGISKTDLDNIVERVKNTTHNNTYK